jgi:hypothetical protein
MRPWSGAILLVLCLVAWRLQPAALAGEEEAPEMAASLAEAIKEGRPGLALRYRFENVSDESPPIRDDDARASTLRTALSFRTGRFRGFSVVVELEDVSDLGLEDEHDNGAPGSLWNGVADRPGIPDPGGTELNEAYLRYDGLPRTTLVAGRQEFGFAAERFLGPVGWRQNHQSFDSFRLTQGSIPRTILNYAFIRNVNRIFGDNHGMRSHALEVEVKVGQAGRLAPYLYLLDYDAVENEGLSTLTYGGRWTGDRGLGGAWSIGYHLELARQEDAGDNPSDVDAEYLRLEAGGKRERWWLRAGFELLGGSPRRGRFRTPLATLHKFNGWADRFLATPETGLEDLYLAAGTVRGSFSATLVAHEFDSDSLAVHYGTEADVECTYTTPWKQVVGLKLASYEADGFSSDSDKVWLWTSYTP